MECNNCGEEVEEFDDTCEECGEEIDEDQDAIGFVALGFCL